MAVKPIPWRAVQHAGDDDIIFSQGEFWKNSFDFVTRLSGSDGAVWQSQTQWNSQASGAGGERRLRTSATLTSLDTDASKTTSTSVLRARNQPKFRRSGTALSQLSHATTGSAKSSVPPELEIGRLRGIASVSWISQWSVGEDYEFGEQLGEGGFGQVWQCTHRKTQSSYAVKVIPAATIKDVERYAREHKVFERLNNPYVVRLHEIFSGGDNVYLVMDLCLGGDLMEYILGYWSARDHPERIKAILDDPLVVHGLPWREAAPFIWQMLAAVAYLHHHRFCHRDVKPENYMIREAGTSPHVQLCDFGLSVRFEKEQPIEGTCGTLKYIAPEVLQGVEYNERCDIWSVGVCSYIVSTLCDPWGTLESCGGSGSCEQVEIQERIAANERAPYPEGKPKEMRQLIDSLMVFDPALRPGAKEVFRTCDWLRRYGRPRQSSCAGCTLA